MLVKHTLSARKNEPSAKRTQDILAIILWPGRGLAVIRFLAPLPPRHLDSGSHKISGEKRNETKAGGGRRRPETWRKTKPERSNIKIHDAKHKTKSAWPGTATTTTTTTTTAKKYTKTKRTKTTLIADTMT